MSLSGIISRGLGVLVAVAYLCLASTGYLTPNLAGPILVGMVLGLLLIWFPETIGGALEHFGPRRTAPENPPFVVALAGWLFLLGVPVVVVLLSK
jgi:hypothetical protein